MYTVAKVSPQIKEEPENNSSQNQKDWKLYDVETANVFNLENA